jgi:hypothetical protein
MALRLPYDEAWLDILSAALPEVYRIEDTIEAIVLTRQ